MKKSIVVTICLLILIVSNDYCLIQSKEKDSTNEVIKDVNVIYNPTQIKEKDEGNEAEKHVSVSKKNDTISDIYFEIKTDKEDYQYGEIMKIDLVILNKGYSTTTIYLHGYGGDQYELKITKLGEDEHVGTEYGGVYTPTTNPLSGSPKLNITLNPNEEKVFHHEWNLYSYSAGGCTGPFYGDIVSPGEYEIVSWLNLDSDYYENRSINDTKIITIENLNSNPLDFNISLFDTSSPGYSYLLNSSKERNIIYLDYTPSNSNKIYDYYNITISIKQFENGFVYVSLNSNVSFNTNLHDEDISYKTIKISIIIEDMLDIIIVGFYDANVSEGWGSFPSQIIDI